MGDKIRDIKTGKNDRNSVPGAPARGLTPRRLAAIVIGDIAGYSRLMDYDEEDTHARVRRIQRDVIEPTITEHYGRLIKTTGDGFVAIFDSPLESVRCSIVIQQNLSGLNAGLEKDQWIEYRIGVNLGDVIIEDDDIYGDGVNVASRIERMTDPGQVYISGGIYEQIKNKLVCGYELLGDRKVKNITDPVKNLPCPSGPGCTQDPKATDQCSGCGVRPAVARACKRSGLVLDAETQTGGVGTGSSIVAVRSRDDSGRARSRSFGCAGRQTGGVAGCALATDERTSGAGDGHAQGRHVRDGQQ